VLTTLVTDPDDPRIAPFVGLRDHELRKRREQPGGDMAGVFICEGDLVVERALLAGYQLTAVLVDAKRSAPFPFELDDAVTVYAAAAPVLVRITGYALHRGMLACFVRRPELDAPTVLDNARRIIVLEGVNNPTNLGVMARSAAALGIDAMLLDAFCCDPLYRRASRVAMGEVFKLPYARLGALPEGLTLLHDRGFELVGLDPKRRHDIVSTTDGLPQRLQLSHISIELGFALDDRASKIVHTTKSALKLCGEGCGARLELN